MISLRNPPPLPSGAIPPPPNYTTTTMDINGLDVTTVDVSGTNFTQVAVAPPAIMGVPEPSSVVLVMLVSVSMVFRRGNFRDK